MAPGTDHPAVQCSLLRGKLRVRGKIPVRLSLWVLGPGFLCFRLWLDLGSPFVQLHPGFVNKLSPFLLLKSAPLLRPVSMVFSDLGIGTPWAESLVYGEGSV